MKGLKLVKDGRLSCHLFVFTLYDTGAFGEDRERSSKGDAQETPAGRIQNAGTGSSDSLGKFGECARELLSEVFYLPGGRRTLSVRDEK